MDPNSSGQSAGKQKIKEKEPVKIRYSLQGLKIGPDQKARCRLRMPANVPALYVYPASEDPVLVLDVRDSSDTHCVTMMRDCVHKNVLHARILMERDPYLLVMVENYTGMLSTYLKTLDPYRPMFGDKSSYHMMPSSKLRFLITQMLNGLFALFQYGKYHGNLKLDNTCYVKTADGNIIPKLTSFKYCKVSGSKSVPHYQAEDVRSIGSRLTKISEIAKDFNKQGYALDCFQIEQLAQRLNTVSSGDVYYTMEEIRAYPFSGQLLREIPLAMDKSNVKDSIEAEKTLCTLPWDKQSYNGFLTIMLKFRQRKNLPAYDFNSRVSYVQFISGLYTHEVELNNPYADVDSTVKSCNPRLCAILYSLLPRAPRPTKRD